MQKFIEINIKKNKSVNTSSVLVPTQPVVSFGQILRCDFPNHPFTPRAFGHYFSNFSDPETEVSRPLGTRLESLG